MKYSNHSLFFCFYSTFICQGTIVVNFFCLYREEIHMCTGPRLAQPPLTSTWWVSLCKLSHLWLLWPLTSPPWPVHGEYLCVNSHTCGYYGHWPALLPLIDLRFQIVLESGTKNPEQKIALADGTIWILLFLVKQYIIISCLQNWHQNQQISCMMIGFS